MLTLTQFIEEARIRREHYRIKSGGRAPSIKQLISSSSDETFNSIVLALTELKLSMSDSSRNPSLESLLSMASKLDNKTFLRLVRTSLEPQGRPNFVDNYIQRLNSAFEGDDDFRSVMDDIRSDQRIKSKEMTEIAEAALGYGLGKISKKSAQARIIEEYSKAGVARVAVAAAKRSKLF
jgi:hypothetical protein